MTVNVGINGFGRMGRLGLRAGWDKPVLKFTQINEIATDANGSAHLLKYDSIPPFTTSPIPKLLWTKGTRTCEGHGPAAIL